MQEKILIVGPAWVGDMVMAQSLFKFLRQKRPGVIIDVLAPGWSLPLISRMPEVANAITMPIGHGQLQLKKRYSIGKSLRANHYTQAIILPNSFKSALIPWIARIPKRTGWLGEMRWGLLNDSRLLDKKQYTLMIERFLALGIDDHATLSKPYPLPELQTTADSQAKALSTHQIEFSKHPILALCPGAEFGSAKRWCEEHYAEIAQTKLKEGWSVWLMGSEKDRTVTNKIMELTNYQCLNLAGKTTLEEAVDLLSLATLVISNDSGLMHIAAALHKPLIAIYGPTSSSFTPPLHAKAKIISLSLPCQPCFQRSCPLKHHACMKELTPKQLLPLISELLTP